VKLIIHLHILLRLRRSGVIPLFSLYVFLECARQAMLFLNLVVCKALKG
jgi:hypothetical protein